MGLRYVAPKLSRGLSDLTCAVCCVCCVMCVVSNVCAHVVCVVCDGYLGCAIFYDPSVKEKYKTAVPAIIQSISILLRYNAESVSAVRNRGSSGSNEQEYS